MDRSGLIVGDIGGTNTRLGLAHRTINGWTLSEVEVAPTAQDLPAMVEAYWHAQGKISRWRSGSGFWCARGRLHRRWHGAEMGRCISGGPVPRRVSEPPGNA
ncbi:MAG: hypothetical protein V4650_12820 [Pseudomonadota bacterium]